MKSLFKKWDFDYFLYAIILMLSTTPLLMLYQSIMLGQSLWLSYTFSAISAIGGIIAGYMGRGLPRTRVVKKNRYQNKLVYPFRRYKFINASILSVLLFIIMLIPFAAEYGPDMAGYSFTGLAACFICAFSFLLAMDVGYDVNHAKNQNKLFFGVFVFIFCLLTVFILDDKSDGFARAQQNIVLPTGIFFVVLPFALNRFMIRRAATGHSGATSKPPPFVKTMNTLFIVAIFIIIGLLVFFQPLQEAFRSGFGWLLLTIMRALNAFWSWVYPIQENNNVQGVQQGNAEMVPPDDTQVPLSPVMAQVMDIVAVVALIALGLLALYGVYRWIRSIKLREPDVQEYETEDYTDEQQDIFSWNAIKGRFGELLERKPRKKRFADCVDDRERVRFSFAKLLTAYDKQEKGVLQLTPNELLHREPLPGLTQQNVEQFVSAYNLARYSEHALPSEAGQLAREVDSRIRD